MLFKHAYLELTKYSHVYVVNMLMLLKMLIATIFSRQDVA